MYIKRQIKRALHLFIMLLISLLILSGCRRTDSPYYDVRVETHSFFYDADELMRDLVRAEIIFMDRLNFYWIHWYANVENIVYDVVRELNPEETDSLLRGLSNMEFTYTTLRIRISSGGPWVNWGSRMYFMQGYAIKLTYEYKPGITFAVDREPFIIVAQTGDYGYGMRRLSEDRAGRRATDDDWNILMTELYFIGTPTLDNVANAVPNAVTNTVMFRIIAVLLISLSVIMLTRQGVFLLAWCYKKPMDEIAKYSFDTMRKTVGIVLLPIGILALFFSFFIVVWVAVLLCLILDVFIFNRARRKIY